MLSKVYLYRGVLKMALKQFKTESKRLLDLMINSIYTHKEIFLRELISNASDAIDKLYYLSLTEENFGMGREDFFIRIDVDKENRTLTITDNGCGMTKDELESNLGTIARSGSLEFKKQLETKDVVEIIGQFGVGFYSAFMVSDKVTVVTRAFGSENAYRWESKGASGYTIDECDYPSHGTMVTLHIKESTEEEDYDEFLQNYRIRSIVKKYSDYIRYPIIMKTERRRLKEGSDKEYETYYEDETLNSMIPLWRRNKNELSDDDYNRFYKDKFYDLEDPMHVIHIKAEGTANYNALLFIPSKPPFNFYTKEYEKGLQLYSNGVLIMDKCADLIPDHFAFVRGLVDSQDLSLNISREMLQHDRQLKLIATSLAKRIKAELAKMLENEREKYEKFFRAFGLQIKFGVYNQFGMNKDILKDLIMFHSSSENKLVTIPEYISRMKEDQKYIYYACGDSIERIARLPQTELVLDKGYEILYLTDDVDEFSIKILDEYEGKRFKSVASGDLDLDTEEEKQAIKERAEANKDLFAVMKEALGDKIKEVRLSTRLKTHPVCLTTDGEVSLEMEKILNAMPMDTKVHAEKVLEINAEHPIFEKLAQMKDQDPEKLKNYTRMLYTQALLIEGMAIDDPVAFSNEICDLMIDKA